jgi:hypothetical protein
MFQNKNTVGRQPVLSDDQGWQVVQQRMVIRGVCKNEIKGVHILPEKVESIGFDQSDAGNIQEFKIFPDGGAMEPVTLNTGDIPATKRGKLETDYTGSREKVENP